MDKIIKYLRETPFHRLMGLLGAILLFGSAGIELNAFGMELRVPLNMHRLFALIGLVLWIMAWYTNEKNKDRERQRQDADVKLRIARLEAGGDPEQDVTLIKPFKTNTATQLKKED